MRDLFPLLSALVLPPVGASAAPGASLDALVADLGARSDALEAHCLTRTKIRNSEVLAERQAHGGRCHVCDGALDYSAPVVAVMTGKRGAHLHLHAGCCSAHSARIAALVDRIMVAAGYGTDERTGGAA